VCVDELFVGSGAFKFAYESVSAMPARRAYRDFVLHHMFAGTLEAPGSASTPSRLMRRPLACVMRTRSWFGACCLTEADERVSPCSSFKHESARPAATHGRASPATSTHVRSIGMTAHGDR
jgi:hypothetical protein